MNQHHTESTASRHHRLEHRKKKAGDSLDFILNSTYDHAAHLFPDDYDILLQNETIAHEMSATATASDDVTPGRGNVLLVIGGVSERRSPHNVRLNLSSHHMSRTAGGYGRKVDGSFYAP
ncbi:hypothetical protein J437_LFUL009644 [Ladona fulva]|uniref:Uncharacterized protein n=1 Tax=Ladona fulva TaxID=123851 RepID=A0A8K0NZE3_LADFU|nr:hypothetical protein J437_LFUL009644 [Ladona fulva]